MTCHSLFFSTRGTAMCSKLFSPKRRLKRIASARRKRGTSTEARAPRQWWASVWLGEGWWRVEGLGRGLQVPKLQPQCPFPGIPCPNVEILWVLRWSVLCHDPSACCLSKLLCTRESSFWGVKVDKKYIYIYITAKVERPPNMVYRTTIPGPNLGLPQHLLRQQCRQNQRYGTPKT